MKRSKKTKQKGVINLSQSDIEKIVSYDKSCSMLMKRFYIIEFKCCLEKGLLSDQHKNVLIAVFSISVNK